MVIPTGRTILENFAVEVYDADFENSNVSEDSVATDSENAAIESDDDLIVGDLIVGLLPLLIQESGQGPTRIEGEALRLADCYYRKQKFEKALEYYEIAQKQAESVSNSQTAICYFRKGKVLDEIKRYNEAIDSYSYAVRLFRQDSIGAVQIEFPNCLEALALLLHKLDRVQEARGFFEEAIRAYKILCKADSSYYVASCLNQYATFLQTLACPIDALKCLDEAQGLFHPVWPDETRSLLEQLITSNRCGLLASIGQYDEALKQSKALFDKLPRGPEKALFLNKIGLLYLGANQADLALQCHKRALDILAGFLDAESIEIAQTFTSIFITIALVRLERFQEAVSEYERACLLFSKLYVPGIDPLKPLLLDGQGFDMYSDNMQYLEELLYYLEIASTALQHKEPNRQSKILFDALFFRFANPQVQVSALAKQLPKLMGALDIVSSSPVAIHVINNFSMYLANAGFLKEARYGFTRALEISKMMHANADHPETADCLDRIARVLFDIGSFAQAKEAFEAAIAIRRKVVTNSSFISRISLAISLDTYGALLIELADFARAKELVVEAYTIRKELLTPDHPHLVLSINNLANLLKQQGQYGEALKTYERAYKRAGANFHSLLQLGKVLVELGEPGEAMEYFKVAYERAKSNLNPALLSHRALADILENIGYCLGYLGKYHEALEKQTQALEARKAYFGERSYQVAQSLVAIGSCQHRIGAYERELVLYKQALEIQRAYFGECHPVVANTFDALGACYTKLQCYAEALQANQKALDLRREVFNTDQHPVIAHSFDNIAFCYSHLERSQEALDYFQKSLLIRRKCFEAGHPLILLSESFIDGCKASCVPYNENTKCLVTKTEFDALVKYAYEYLESINDPETVVLEKNPTGFVRLRLQVPQELAHKIETVRLNFWTPQVKIKVVEAPHNHPRYFESMVIHGGYSHNLFVPAQDATDFVISRIFKGAQEQRHILHAGKISLKLERSVNVQAGAMIPFPRSVVHQVTHAMDESLSINCLLKQESNRNYYDVYLPRYSEQDPQVEREALLCTETGLIVLRIKKILAEWLQKLALQVVCV